VSALLALASRRATTRLAARIARELAPGDLVVLSGPLGAGKTFLVRAICRSLGLPPRVRVTSPTFALIHEYEARLPIVHVDLYRLTRPSELRELGLTALRDEARLLLVEWGEPYLEELGGDALVVELAVGAGTPRHARLKATGPRSGEILRGLESSP
jgi:tRNA threonylcarbamoyladenosine biosynthesis protein TsaE